LSRRSLSAWLALVLAATFAAYAPSLRNRFAFDDRFVAKAVRDSGQPNAMVHELQPITKYFASGYWHGVRDDDILYRPLTVWSYALLYAAIGRHLEGEAGEALPQHALNVLLHVLATWLVYRLARELRCARRSSLLAAAVFGLHAVHSEVVAGIVGRAELLAFCAGAGACLAYAAADRAAGSRRVALLGAAAVAVFVASCSKETGVVWAPFLPLFAVARALAASPTTPLGPALVREVRPTLAATAVPLAAFFLLRAGMIAGLGPDAAAEWARAHEHSTAGNRLLAGWTGWGYGLWLTVAPFRLACDYGPQVFAPVTSALDVRFLGAFAATVGIGVGGVWALRRAPLATLAAATWLAHGFLTSNVPFRIGTDVAERLYYAPSLGLSFAVAWLAARLAGGAARIGAVALALWLAWSTVTIVVRNPVWRDDRSLFTHEVDNQPRSARMHMNLAQILLDDGQVDRGIEHLRIGVGLFPEHARGWNHLGVQNLHQGRIADAIADLERSIAARHTDATTRVDACINLAVAHVRAGAPERAREPLELALRIDAAKFAARVDGLIAGLAEQLDYRWFAGLIGQARTAVPTALRWDYWLGRLAYRRQEHEDAIAAFEAFLRSGANGDDRHEARLLLASSLAQAGRLDDAARTADALANDPAAPARTRADAGQLAANIKNSRR
jgi:cytochrome c-type biogenesis protein CcmH/NrfG